MQQLTTPQTNRNSVNIIQKVKSKILHLQIHLQKQSYSHKQII